MPPLTDTPELSDSEQAFTEALVHLSVKLRDLGRQVDRLETEMHQAINEATASRFEG